MKNKVKIFCGNTMKTAFDELLKEVEIESKNLFSNNIIIVPDKYSMNIERYIFERLNLTSTFNIEVLTFTRLINRYCEKILKNKNVINKQTGILVVSKILLNNEKDFVQIKNIKNSPSLSSEIYETILQLKSSGITPEELISIKQNANFDYKLKDIKLIYSLYEQNLELNNRLDSADVLKILSDEIKNNETIKNSNVFVGMFDTFSFKQLNCIKNLVFNAKKFDISLASNTLQNNKNIYINETFNDIIELLKTNYVDYEITNCYYKSNDDFCVLSKNLFGINDKRYETKNNLFLIEAENVEQEIDFISRKIKYLVVNNNYKFSDFNIACANFENYKPYIETSFDNFTIPYYCDYSVSLNNHFVGRFINNILNIISSNFEREFVLEFLHSKIFNFDKEEVFNYENYVLEFGINYSLFLNKIEDEKLENIRLKVFENLEILYKNIKKSEKIHDFIENLTVFIEKINFIECLNTLKNSEFFDIDFKDSLDKAYEKFIGMLSLIDNEVGDNICSFDYFVSLLNSLISSININTVPLGVNRVFVGDINSSSFYPTKVLFLVGAVDGSVPSYKNDCGIITDSEIENLKSKNILNPSIRLVNKCSKYKIFETCLIPNEMLFVSYSTLSFGTQTKPSEIFTSFQNIFYKDNNILPIYKISSEEQYLDLHDVSFEFVYGGKQLLSLVKNGNKKTTNYLSAKKVLDNKNNKNELVKDEVIDGKKLFFNSLNTSVSQIERYFNCPYKHFVDYGLKLKEKEIYGLKRVDVGIFLHNVAELFVKFLINNNFKYEIHDINKIIDECIKKQKIVINEEADKFKIDNLKKEAKSFCLKIYNQINSSEFKPKYAEFSFKDYKITEDVKIKGKIDRLDKFNNFFLIMDYKTGHNEFSFRDIYYGNKIQILMYMLIIEEIYNIIPAGAFYIPVKNNFKQPMDDDKNNGFFIDNENVIKALDTCLENEDESKFYNIKFKDGKLKTINNALNSEELFELKKYVKNLMKNAIEEICEGNIKPNPAKDACNFCKYKLMCKYSIKNNGERLNDGKVNKQTFLNLNEGEKDGNS